MQLEKAFFQQDVRLYLAAGQPIARMLCQQTVRGSCLKSSTARLSARAPLRPISSRRQAVVTKAAMDTNFFVNLIASTACGAMATAVTLVTAENTDAEVRDQAGYGL
jgi:hypothetical protein